MRCDAVFFCASRKTAHILPRSSLSGLSVGTSLASEEDRDAVDAREPRVPAEDLCETAAEFRVDLVDTLAGILRLSNTQRGSMRCGQNCRIGKTEKIVMLLLLLLTDVFPNSLGRSFLSNYVGSPPQRVFVLVKSATSKSIHFLMRPSAGSASSSPRCPTRLHVVIRPVKKKCLSENLAASAVTSHCLCAPSRGT